MSSSGADPLFANVVLRSLVEDVANGSFPDQAAYGRRFATYAEEVSRLWDGLQDGTTGNADDELDRVVRALVDRLGEDSIGAEDSPERIGRFLIKRRLGRGGQGQVFLATDPSLGRDVAVKVLSHARFSSDTARRRFEREARLLSSLADPGICAIHETGVVDGVPFIVMPFFQNGAMSARIGRPAESEGILDWVRTMERIARALAVAHEAGVVHRDLNPRNILFDKNDAPVIADFGLARSPTDDASLTLDGDVFGTPPYMAPEQACGNVRLDDVRIDIHALGVTLFECLAGRLPWTAPTTRGLIQVMLDEPPLRLRTANRLVSRDIEVVVATAMAAVPADRYVDAGSFADDLGRAARGEPVRARPVGRLVRTLRWCRRNIALSVSTVAIIATLAAALITSLDAIEERDLALEETAAALLQKSRALDDMDVALRREHALRLLTEAGQLATTDPVAAAQCVLEAAPIADRARVWPVARVLAESLHEEWRCAPEGWTRMIVVAVDDAGRFLSAGDENGRVLIADRLERRILWSGRVHDGWVTDLESLGGGEFVSAGDDGSVHRLSSRGRAQILSLGPSRPIASVAFDARRGRLHVLDGGDGWRSLCLDRPDEVAIHAEGHAVARVRTKVARRANLQSRFLVIDSTRDALWIAARNQARLVALETGSDSGETIPARRLVLGRSGARVRCPDMTSIIWTSGSTTATIDGFEQRIASIAIQAESDELAVAVNDRIALHVLEDGAVRRTLDLRGHHGAVTNVVAMRHGRWASIGEDATLRIWRSRPAAHSDRFRGRPQSIDPSHRRRVVVDERGQAAVRDIATDIEICRLDGEFTLESPTAWHGDGRLAVVVGHSLRILDATTGRCLARRPIEERPLDIGWRGDHEIVLVTSAGIGRFEARSLESIGGFPFEGKLDENASVVLHGAAPEGIIAIMVRGGSTMPIVRLHSVDGRLIAEWIHGGIERGSSSAVTAFSGDGKVVAYVARGVASGTATNLGPSAVVRHLDGSDRVVHLSFQDDRRSVRGVAISADGRHCAVASEQDGATDRDLLTVHETTTGECSWSVSTPALIAVEWSWDADTLLAIPTRGEVLVIGTRERAVIGTLPTPWPRHQRIHRSPAGSVFYFDAPIGLRPAADGPPEFAAVIMDPLSILRRSIPAAWPVGTTKDVEPASRRSADGSNGDR